MFQVGHTLISDDVAFADFACNLTACRGACCVVGDAGAPVEPNEVPVLNKAWKLLKDELSPESRQAVAEKGLVSGKDDGLELACVGDAACVFVQYGAGDVATCAIQKAFYDGRFDWEKPISCHLYPIRITSIGALDYLNFEYVPSICAPGKKHGRITGTGLAEFLREPLSRKYGSDWYEEFMDACRHVRSLSGKGGD